jgi:hypothetical protein
MPSTEKYCTAIEVFSAIGQADQTTDLTQMNRIIDSVSRLIDGYMNRQDYGFVALSTAAANIYAGDGKNYLFIADCISVTTVKMKTSLSSTTYDYTFQAGEVLPFRGSPKRPQYNKTPYTGILIAYNATYPRFTSGNPANVSRKWQRLHPDSNESEVSLPTVEVTAKWGYAETVPPVIKEACIIEAMRIYKQEEAGMADSGFNANLGETRFVRSLHPTVKDMLNATNLKMGKVPGLRR